VQLRPPIAPQLARPARELPRGERWLYEPKLDGYRAIVFVDGEDADVRSRNDRPLTRYFPELRFPPGRYVLDGEIVVDAPDGEVSFELLGQRIHPAVSRITRLAEETPARLAAFDLLAVDDEELLELPLAERRRLAEARLPAGLDFVESTLDPDVAARWLREGEGVIAKDLDAPYRPGAREGMVKVRRRRTIDCVVMGWRPGVEGRLGALILGLYDGDALRPVGHASGFTAARRRELRELVRPIETGARGRGEPTRWSGGRDTEWVELRPELVVEVEYDHASGGRIRHGAQLVRLRPDRTARECLFSQLS
jgi:ATP-dependent DNA ligase